MKEILSFLLFISMTLNTMSQERDLDWNMILEIDDEIELSYSFKEFKLVQERENGEIIEYDANYVPGSLKIQNYDPQFFNEGKLHLVFSYFRSNSLGNYYVSEYKINFYKSWLRYDYVIFDIHNMDKEENKKRYPKQADKDYIYGYKIPGTIFTWEE